MKRKGLCLLIALALGGGALVAQAGVVPAHAAVSGSGASAPQTVQTMDDSQDSWADGYDNRWYVALTGGAYVNDVDRQTDSWQVYYGLSLGRFISKNASIDLFVDRTSRDNFFRRGNWGTNSYGLAARFYARDWNDWRPYAKVAVMASREINPLHHSWTPAAELGVGLSKTITDMADFRVEAGYRHDFDNETIRSQNGYGDWLLGVSLMQRFGAPRSAPSTPAPVVPPPVVAPAPPPPPSCDQLDDDNDGVNNCEDQCPATAAGILVGPNGCPQKVVIDLRGVNFKFDRPSKGETDVAPTLRKPTADSMMILKQAVDTLKRYPQVKVTVAGFTDSVGAASYNQGLSERRAKIVFDYLVAHGVDTSRLEGPVGHGEDNPVASNKTDDGRARNRRVELQPEQ